MRFVGVVLVEFGDCKLSVFEVRFGFPGCTVSIHVVALPLDQVLKFAMSHPRIEDFFDFIFEFVLDLNRWRRRLFPVGDLVGLVGFEE